MNILTLWREQLTAKSLKTIGSLWWQNSREFFRILLRDWWPLVIFLLVEDFSGLIFRLTYAIEDQTASTLFIPVALAFAIVQGSWYPVRLLIAHPTISPKNRYYYRSHLVFILVLACLANYLEPLLWITQDYTLPLILIYYTMLPQFFFIFACFFILDTRPSIRGYLKALTINPLRLLVLNLPISVILWFILRGVEFASRGTIDHQMIGSLILAPLFLVLCGVVYKMAIEKNREEF